MKKILSLILLLSFSIKAQDVTIGTQTWTSKNLDVETYRNGDKIPQVIDSSAWVSLSTGAWCYFKNKVENGTKYGKLYNWYAVNDPRGLAPKGYHMPSDKEWTTLTDNLGGGSETGIKMKSTSGWKENFRRNDRNGNGTNTSGFEGLPVGCRLNNVYNVQGIGEGSFWWSSSESSPANAWYRNLGYLSDGVLRNNYDKHMGFSVRCLKD